MSDVFFSSISLIFLLSFMSFFKFKNFTLQHNLFSHKPQNITEQITANVIVNENRLPYKLHYLKYTKLYSMQLNWVFRIYSLSIHDLINLLYWPHNCFVILFFAWDSCINKIEEKIYRTFCFCYWDRIWS